MNGELLILFVILLLGLILCSFLGGRGCIEGMESTTVYYGPNGASAVIQVDSNGNDTLVVTTSDGVSNTYTYTDTDVYTGPNGATAIIKQTTNGATAVQIKDSNGNIILTLTNNQNTGNSTASTQYGTAVNTNNYDNYNHYDGSSSPTIFYGPDEGTAKVVKTENENTIVITNKNGSTEVYYIDTSSGDPNVSVYYGPNGGSAKMITDGNGNKAIEITTPSGSKVVYTGDNTYANPGYDSTINQYYADASTYTPAERVDNNTYSRLERVDNNTYSRPERVDNNTYTPAERVDNNTYSRVERVDNNTYTPAERVDNNTYRPGEINDYYDSLPPGIPRSQIPPGDEDLYILKSQVVPPVCPRCPDPICPDNFDANKCPPCPPCARCPEPAFDCKKVPNYNAFNQNYMPIPVLTDFSGFGI
jgi:hypothetical protein